MPDLVYYLAAIYLFGFVGTWIRCESGRIISRDRVVAVTTTALWPLMVVSAFATGIIAGCVAAVCAASATWTYQEDKFAHVARQMDGYDPTTLEYSREQLRQAVAAAVVRDDEKTTQPC